MRFVCVAQHRVKSDTTSAVPCATRKALVLGEMGTAPRI